ncbi:GNAT family N-acetyltransferase [Stackebrandtia nassauensis]|uniref:GCN5-related N-acetyltransferase n=1 Tax=Stackebrandtia nassauensis (strain DSM 44728 / CIP 108903 / NRRL B-16338 / NBRC 102104 / LLR-40K-21) TaxID=446470 RepID=D3PV28_STANL|nr:GNAT family N-acetyltransferase [Stackebrandtia nassauensis]ADD41081.1 GCN5-related N-acetyltransferase [Stackebrandtia nassauensis DSM 44728]
MNAPYDCELVSDITAFAADTRDWLAEGPLSNNVTATLVAQRADGTVATEPDGLWLKVMRGGEVAGVVIQTPPRGLLLTAMDTDAVAAVVDAISRVRPQVPAANGPKRVSDHFAALWSVRTGCTATAIFSSRMYQVTDVRPPANVVGRRRAATLADRDTVAAWLLAWAADGSAASEAPGLRHLVATYEARLTAGQPQWIWEVDGEAVSFAMESPPSAGVVRLQAVYTPDMHRSNGYASALVARISSDVLARPGVRACTLYTDLSNPVSNNIYRRIGYRPVEDSVNYGFEYPT